MGFFSRVGRFFKTVTERWLKPFVIGAFDKVIIPVAKEVGKAGLAYIDAQIAEQMELDIPATEKFNNVVKNCKKSFGSKAIANSSLNALIQLRYAYKKKF